MLSSLAKEQTLGFSQIKICLKIAFDLQSDIPSSCSALKNVIVRGVALTGPSEETSHEKKQQLKLLPHTAKVQQSHLSVRLAHATILPQQQVPIRLFTGT